MSRRVAIVAGAQTRFGAHPDRSVQELFAEAVGALNGPLDRVEAAFVGSLGCGEGLQFGNFAPALLDYAGLPPVPSLHVESACASGGFALLQAIAAVKSGQATVALAAGVEKMRDTDGEQGRHWLSASCDSEYERPAGLTLPGLFGLMASRLIFEGAVSREEMAWVAVKNHQHGLLNPKAMLRRPVTVRQVLDAPMVAAPLGALDCSPAADGAACVLVVAAEFTPLFTDCPVEVAGFGAASDALALHDRRWVCRLPAVGRACMDAYRAAGVGVSDLDLIELHDSFTVAELLAYDEIGLCPVWEGGARLRSGEFDLDGKLPVNPSGGLKAKGHPVGATGIAQVVELWEQLRGEAGERQVRGAELGLAVNMGGSGASATAIILRRGVRR